MKDGFIRVAAATPQVKVADTRWDREQIRNADGLAAPPMLTVRPAIQFCPATLMQA